MELQNYGIRTAIGSSSRGAEAMVSALGLDSLFEVVVTVDGETGEHRSALYRALLSELGTAPEKSVLFEDENDQIVSANALGLRTVGVGHPDSVEAAEQRLMDFSTIELSRFVARGEVG